MDTDYELTFRYESYVLRLRWSEQEDRPRCQAMLHRIVTNEIKYFSDLEGLVDFLNAQAKGTYSRIYDSGNAL